MQKKIDPIVFNLVKPHIEISADYIEKNTAQALERFRAYLAAPEEDITGLRLDTLIMQANDLKRTYDVIERSLKRLQGEEQ